MYFFFFSFFVLKRCRITGFTVFADVILLQRRWTIEPRKRVPELLLVNIILSRDAQDTI